MMMKQSSRHIPIRAHFHPFHVRSPDGGFANESRQLRHAGMSQGTGGKWLDRDSWILERPRLAQAIDNRGRIVCPTIGMEEPPLCFQNLFCCRPANRSEVRCDHAGLGGMARLKGLHHCAEVLPQTGGVAGGDAECPRRVHYVQPFELGAGGSSPEDSASAGGMKAIFVVARRNCLRD